MKIQFEDLEIELVSDQNFTPFSADNIIDYNFKYFAEEIEKQTCYLTSRLGILVKNQTDFEEKLINSAIICETGGATGIYKDTFLIEEANLLICVCDKIYSISLPTLELNWKVQADEATCFSIHRFSDGYIIHGELAITYLGKSGEILWQFLARDIFVTIDSQKDFTIENDTIIVKDWSGYEYHLNADGKVIREIKPTHNN